jgi:hypothetical protein
MMPSNSVPNIPKRIDQSEKRRKLPMIPAVPRKKATAIVPLSLLLAAIIRYATYGVYSDRQNLRKRRKSVDLLDLSVLHYFN